MLLEPRLIFSLPDSPCRLPKVYTSIHTSIFYRYPFSNCFIQTMTKHLHGHLFLCLLHTTFTYACAYVCIVSLNTTDHCQCMQDTKHLPDRWSCCVSTGALSALFTTTFCATLLFEADGLWYTDGFVFLTSSKSNLAIIAFCKIAFSLFSNLGFLRVSITTLSSEERSVLSRQWLYLKHDTQSTYIAV